MEESCSQLHRCPGHPDTIGMGGWQCKYCLCWLPTSEQRQVHVQRCRAALPKRWRGTPTVRERQARRQHGQDDEGNPNTDTPNRNSDAELSRPGAQRRDRTSQDPSHQQDIRTYFQHRQESRPAGSGVGETQQAHAPVLPLSQIAPETHPPEDRGSPDGSEGPLHCGLCQERLVAPTSVLPCGHVLHERCWLSRCGTTQAPPPCPICEESSDWWSIEPHCQGDTNVPMWRLIPILGAAANPMPEPTRMRWREDLIWGPLFVCLLDVLRARGP